MARSSSRRAAFAHGGPGFCLILGKIQSIDPAANPIRFEINLPDAWNRKAVQFGGGAFNGWLHQSDGLGQTVVGDKNLPTPLARVTRPSAATPATIAAIFCCPTSSTR